MNTSSVIESDQKVEMEIQSCNDENKVNHGLCMAAGIKTPNADKSRVGRRHFPHMMSSDIFNFYELPAADIKSSVDSADPENFCMSAGTETLKLAQKQDEKLHFHLPPEDFITSENDAHQDEQVDSAEKVESDKIETDADENSSERRHFYDKTSSNIFFCGLSQDSPFKDNPDPFDFKKKKGAWNSFR